MRASFTLTRLSLAGAVLGIGGLFYTQARPSEITYNAAAWLPTLPIGELIPPVLEGCLPSALHSFAFVLLTATVVDCRRIGALVIVGLVWLVIEAMFEFLQHPSIVALALPDNLAILLTRGTFDWFDLIAAFLGCSLAVCTAASTTIYARKKPTLPLPST